MNVPRRGVLLAIVGGGAILLTTVLMSRGEDPAAARSRPATRSRARASQSDETKLGDVKLELLQRAPGTLEEPDRNPFRFEARAAPAPPAAAPSGGGGASRTVAPPSQATAPAGPPPPPPLPPIPLRFIGLVDAPSQAGRVAILSDGKGNVFYGKEGDTIEGRYRMLRVAPEAVELAYVDGRGRQSIRLSGQ